MRSITYLSSIVDEITPLRPKEIVARFNGPRVLCNSLPKAGTHLLSKALSLFPHLTRTCKFGLLYSASRDVRLDLLSRVGRGQYSIGHIPWSSELAALMNQRNIKHVLIIRDLRDVAVSQMHYIMNLKRSYVKVAILCIYRRNMHKRHSAFSYFSCLGNDHERLMACITGVNTPIQVPGIREVAEAFAPWLDEETCCVIRFEDLIGLNGGGNKEDQNTAIEKIARHLRISLTPSEIDYITRNLFSRKSTTFRKGVVEDWKNHLTEKHKEVLKRRAGQMLIDFGYETDFDW